MRRGRTAVRLFLLLLFACGAVCACVTRSVNADVRFGDSLWVAPGADLEGVFGADGPRVAARDGERRWETALRAPFRVGLFPLRLVADGLEAGVGYLGPRYFDPKPMAARGRGLAVAPHVALDAMNDIGLGPAITWAGFPTPDARLDVSGSWSTIDRRRAHFGGVLGDRRPVGFRLRADYDAQPNRRYYGVGNDTPRTGLSYFMLESADVEAGILLGSAPLRRLRIIGGFSSMSPRRGYNGSPVLEDVLAPGAGPFAHRSTRELWYGVAGELASLDDGRDPSRGLHALVDLRRAAGLRSGDPDYDQWRLEGRAYVPVFAKRRVIAVRGVFTGIEPRGEATPILPFYRLARSVGATRFAGYASERFCDRQLILARIEYRWAILYRMSALTLVELGAVAPRLTSFRLSNMHPSYGGGLRLGLNDAVTLRCELARSVEGYHAVLALGGDF